MGGWNGPDGVVVGLVGDAPDRADRRADGGRVAVGVDNNFGEGDVAGAADEGGAGALFQVGGCGDRVPLFVGEFHHVLRHSAKLYQVFTLAKGSASYSLSHSVVQKQFARVQDRFTNPASLIMMTAPG